MTTYGYLRKLAFGAVLFVSACQTTAEQLAELEGESGSLKPPEISERSGGSAFVALEPRKGVTQKFGFIKAKKPVANVLLFAGGGGVINLIKNTSSRPGIMGAKLNFLIRSKEKFISRDLNVVLVDAPSDKKGERGMRGGFRTSARHVNDVEGIIDFVRQRSGLPVWLVGTSRGTESAAYIAIHSRNPVDGLVLTSPISVSNKSGRDIKGHDLEKIRVPVQIVYHRNDGCRVTAPSGARAIGRSLPNAKIVEVKEFTGGGPAISGPCDARSEHGFFLIEDSVVESIAAFIKANI